MRKVVAFGAATFLHFLKNLKKILRFNEFLLKNDKNSLTFDY